MTLPSYGEFGAHSSGLECRTTRPTEIEPVDHRQADPQRAQISDIAAFALPDARMECDRTLDEIKASAERGIEEIRVEFEIDGGRQPRQQPRQSVVVTQLVGRADVRECATAKVLCLKQLADKKMP